MQEPLLALAARVIRKADPAHPADAVLRAEFKRERGLAPSAAREVTRAVFASYRWRGWLDLDAPVEAQLREARLLATRFAAGPGSFSDEELLARAVPPWTHEVMKVTPAWVRSLQAEPRLWLRPNTPDAEEIATQLDQCRPEPLGDHNALEYLGSRDLFATPEFHAGAFEIQDISSQAVGLVCAPRPGETWWDACAGEGGKLLHLSALMRNKGLIWASDRADWRLKRLKLRAGRARAFNYRAAPWEGGAKLPTKTKFDGVLLDAPCSGLGTWQRNPHARWTTTATDVQELAVVQRQLLRHAAGALKPGGRLIYAVCTLPTAETSGVAEAFAADGPEFAPLAFTNPFNGAVAGDGRVLLWPQDTGGNGMFIAAWERR